MLVACLLILGTVVEPIDSGPVQVNLKEVVRAVEAGASIPFSMSLTPVRVAGDPDGDLLPASPGKIGVVGLYSCHGGSIEDVRFHVHGYVRTEIYRTLGHSPDELLVFVSFFETNLVNKYTILWLDLAEARESILGARCGKGPVEDALGVVVRGQQRFEAILGDCWPNSRSGYLHEAPCSVEELLVARTELDPEDAGAEISWTVTVARKRAPIRGRLSAD